MNYGFRSLEKRSLQQVSTGSGSELALDLLQAILCVFCSSLCHCKFSSVLLTTSQKTHNERKRERRWRLMSYRRSHERRSRLVGSSNTRRVFGDIPPDLRFRVFFTFLKNIEKKKKKMFRKLNYLMGKTGRLFGILTCSCAVSLTFLLCWLGLILIKIKNNF